jgi:uncharacterized protein YjiS (DUF1127 family)
MPALIFVNTLIYKMELTLCNFIIALFAALHISFVHRKNKAKDVAMFETLRIRYTAWKKYSRTVSELEALSNRDLSDLGLSRGDITRVAREAAR